MADVQEDSDAFADEESLESLRDTIKKDIATSERGQNIIVSHSAASAAERSAASTGLARSLLLTIYSILPGSISGLLIVYMATLAASAAFFYDADQLFYQGVFIILLGTCFATLPIALLSRFPGISASVSNINAVLMGLFVYSLIVEKRISYDIASKDYFEILISMVVVGLSVASMFLLVGVMRISRIFAFAPEVIFATMQVVIAMMLVIISYSLLSGEIVTNWPAFLASISADFFDDPKVQFVLIVGFGMAIITSMFSSQIVLPILLVFLLLGFHLGARGFMQMDTAQLIAEGWLLPLGDVNVSDFAVSKLNFDNFSEFQFGMLREHLTDIVVISLVLLISSLEVNRRLEETVETYVHPAHEITAASFSSVVSAFTGGFSVQHSYTPTVVSHRLGGRKRSAGLAAGAVCGLVAFFGMQYLYIIPTPLIIATMFHFAILYFIKWLVKGIRTLDFMEYVLVVCALLITVFLGYNAGLIFGLLAGAVVFMLTHSQISGIKRVVSGKLYHSSTERLPQTVKILDTYGDTILVIQLEATLVYGMMYEIIHMVVGRNNDTRYNPLGYILLDFSAVRNIDVTVLDQMNGLFDVAEHHDILIIICGLQQQHAELFKRIGFLKLRRSLTIKIMPTLDTSLEWCEDDLIQTIARLDNQVVDFNFETWLSDRLGDAEAYSRLQSYMQEEVLQAGENISQHQSQSNKLYFIKHGSVDVTLDVPNQESVHLRKLKEGSLIGELGFYLGIKRNVTLRALEQTVVMTLERETLVKISNDDPGLMIALHRLVVIYLSTRISYTNRMLQVLLASDHNK